MWKFGKEIALRVIPIFTSVPWLGVTSANFAAFFLALHGMRLGNCTSLMTKLVSVTIGSGGLSQQVGRLYPFRLGAGTGNPIHGLKRNGSLLINDGTHIGKSIRKLIVVGYMFRNIRRGELLPPRSQQRFWSEPNADEQDDYIDGDVYHGAYGDNRFRCAGPRCARRRARNDAC